MDRIHIRVFPDMATDPVWNDDGGLSVDDLPISQTLRDEIRQWGRLADRMMTGENAPDLPNWDEWEIRTPEFVSRLQEELGDEYLVTPGPEMDTSA